MNEQQITDLVTLIKSSYEDIANCYPFTWQTQLAKEISKGDAIIEAYALGLVLGFSYALGAKGKPR